jgi:cytidylate kinase
MMPIVTISRGSYSRGKEVAEKVAKQLGFQCISREVLIEASEEFNVPEIQLLRAVRDAPSVLDRFSFGKERYVAYIQAALLEHFQKDNVVYHGLAGHYFVKNVSHVIKVRVIGEKKDRVKLLMEREATFEQAASAMKGILRQGLTLPASHRGITEEKALRVLEDLDAERRRWGLHLYGIDTHDPNLYDLVIPVRKLSTDDAADIVSFAARLDRFQATPESQQAIEDLLLAARIKAELIESYPRIKVVAKEGAVYIGLEGGSSGQEVAIRDVLQRIPGVEKIDINVYPFVTPD